MMSRTRKSKTLILKGVIVFFAFYGLISYLFVIKTNLHHSKQLQTHATIIADDVWNLNYSGTKAYLNLAMQADHYKKVRIHIDQEETFITTTNNNIGKLDLFLEKVYLVWTREMSATINFQGETIGTLEGEKFVRLIYPLVNIFLFQFFLTITGIFIQYLFHIRRSLEQQVAERTRRYHELVNLLPEMVLETDAVGKILFANEIALSRFGIEEEKICDYSCTDLIVISENDEQFWTFDQNQNPSQEQYNARKKDNSTFPVLIRSAPITSDEQIIGARVVIVDITDRIALENQLNRDQKMKSIGMMAGGVAHDLNNILSGIVNYPELMLMQLPKDSNLRKYIQPMKDAGLRAAAVVADLLTVARGVAATRKAADVETLIEDYLDSPEFHRLLSTYPQLEYATRFNSQPGPGLISCSDIHVRKCLMNLIANAAESMSGKGRIEILTTKQQVDENLVKKLSLPEGEGTYVTISIHDQGPGIAAKDLAHIFEPFYTKKEMGRSGTGLGLTVVWNTMEDHNGGVAIDTSSEGTTFTLYFPFHDKAAPVAVVKDVAPSYEGKGQTVLVIDDEEQQRDIAHQLLTSFGYRVSIVASGEDAIAFLTDNPVDLLLLDMVIGAGLSGLQTYTKILQLYPTQKAVIVSGYSESEDVKATLKLGAGSLLKKPYTKEQLAKEVYKELHR